MPLLRQCGERCRLPRFPARVQVQDHLPAHGRRVGAGGGVLQPQRDPHAPGRGFSHPADDSLCGRDRRRLRDAPGCRGRGRTRWPQPPDGTQAAAVGAIFQIAPRRASGHRLRADRGGFYAARDRRGRQTVPRRAGRAPAHGRENLLRGRRADDLLDAVEQRRASALLLSRAADMDHERPQRRRSRGRRVSGH